MTPTLSLCLFLLCFVGCAEFLQRVRRFRNHTEKHSLERGTLQWSKITGPWNRMVCSWVFHSQFQEKNGIFFPLRILLFSYFEVHSTYMYFFPKPLDFISSTHLSIMSLLYWFVSSRGLECRETVFKYRTEAEVKDILSFVKHLNLLVVSWECHSHSY